jgi:uroporphyrin-III C-methyltransferase
VLFATPRAGEGERANDWARGVCAADSAVLYMAAGQAIEIASALLARGMSSHTPVMLVENASLPTSRTDVMTLQEMQHLPRSESRGPTVLMLGEAFRAALIAKRADVSVRTAAG